MTVAAVEAIETLRAEGKIHMRPASLLTYMIDGKTLRLPIAKRLRHLKSPRWAPVYFSPGPSNSSNR